MFTFPWSNFHDLNLDWILSVVKQAKDVFDTGRDDIDYAVETADEAKTIATQAAAATIADNSISTAKLQNDAVTTAKLADNSVTSDKIVNHTITGNDIAENTITNYNIQNGSIIGADLDDATITGDKIANATITGSKIATKTITGSNIDDGTITTDNIQTGSLVGADLADGTITGSKIANGAITNQKLYDGAVSKVKLDQELNDLITPTSAALTGSGNYATIVNQNYSSSIYRAGHVGMCQLSVALKARTGSSGWLEVFTLPVTCKYRTTLNVLTQDGKTEQVRIENDKCYLNLFNTVVNDETLSVIIPFIIE